MTKRNFRLTVHFYLGAAHPAARLHRRRISYPTRERAEYELKRVQGRRHLTIIAAYIGERG